MAKIQAANSGSQFTYSLIEKDVYEARLVRMVLIGMQKQRPFQGKAKPDAIVAKCAFELIGETVTVTDGDGKEESKPALVFKDILVPGAGVTRGHMFDLIQAVDGGDATFGDTEEYKELVNLPLMVEVGSYTNQNTGKEVNCVDNLSKMNKRAKERLEDSTVDTVFFCPYTDSEDMKAVYAGLGKFVQDKLASASDSDHMPCIKDQWPTEAASSDDGDDGEEF